MKGKFVDQDDVRRRPRGGPLRRSQFFSLYRPVSQLTPGQSYVVDTGDASDKLVSRRNQIGAMVKRHVTPPAGYCFRFAVTNDNKIEISLRPAS